VAYQIKFTYFASGSLTQFDKSKLASLVVACIK